MRLCQGFGGQEEHGEQPFFELYVIFVAKNPADRQPNVRAKGTTSSRCPGSIATVLLNCISANKDVRFLARLGMTEKSSGVSV
jgi:hypothetical protein